MTSYIHAELRRLVEIRAHKICEYCLIHENDTYLGCQIDHIISEKHGGLTEVENLCYACTICNRAKGSDIGSVVPGNSLFTRFYNPRKDNWLDNFMHNGALIESKTAIGEVTSIILGFNTPERLLERETLMQVGHYLSPEAKKLMSPAQT